MRIARVVTVLLLVAASAARAQTYNVLHNEVDRGVTLPPTSAAYADEATSVAVNPAGLTYVRQLQAFYLYERSAGKLRNTHSVFVGDTFFRAFGVGFNHDWVNGFAGSPTYRKYSWAFSLGSPWASFGWGINWFRSETDPELNALRSVDLGLMLRPVRHLSLGATIKNVDAPTSGTLTLGRHYDVALGVRPIGERLTLGVDFLWNERTQLSGARLSYTANAELFHGFVLNAGLSHAFNLPGVQFQLGLTVNAPFSGIGYTAGGSAAGADHVLQARLSTEKYRSLPVRQRQIAYLDLGEELLARTSAAQVLFGGVQDDPYVTLLRKLDAASRDDRLGGLVLKIDGLPEVGMAKALELRQALMRLRANGKRVLVLFHYATDAEYLVASAADKILAVPEAFLTIDGFAANVTFLGGALQKLGIDFDVARVGAYKNAPDMFTRTGMSTEQRETVNAYLDSTYRNYQGALEQSRGLGADRLKAILQEGLLAPRRAKELGVIDDVVLPQDVEKIARALVPGGRITRRYDPWDVRETRWGLKKRIGIVPIIGDIVTGKSRGDPLGLAQVAGSETVVRALEAARRDPTLSAIVLRVDSRGGSGLGSDLIYRAVLEAKAQKPVVASMGDAAASGGYYVAMGADEIYAAPTTLTGSIGVFVLKPAAQKLTQKLGIDREVLQRGPMSNLFDFVKPWSDAERAVAQRWVDGFYDDFITEVAKSRKTDKAAIDKIARGRVWAGDDAKARGLVDHHGGLHDAVEAAKRRARLAPDEEVEWVLLTEPRGGFAELADDDGLVAKLTSGIELPQPAAPELFRKAAQELGFDPVLLAEPGIKAMLPFTLHVR